MITRRDFWFDKSADGPWGEDIPKILNSCVRATAKQYFPNESADDLLHECRCEVYFRRREFRQHWKVKASGKIKKMTVATFVCLVALTYLYELARERGIDDRAMRKAWAIAKRRGIRPRRPDNRTCRMTPRIQLPHHQFSPT